MATWNLYLVSFGVFVVIASFVGIANSESVGQRPQPHPALCLESDESSDACRKIDEPLYLLYTDANNPEKYNQIFLNKNDTHRIAQANPTKGSVWKILIHGFVSNSNSSFPVNVRQAYMERTRKTGIKYNILVVDWGRAACASLDSAKNYMYDYAAKNVAQVGRHLGDLIVLLHEQDFLNLKTDVHMIGFSLGAHVAGQAGRRVWDKTGATVRRISGLDPAGPAFWAWDVVPSFMIPLRRLHRKDTQFADIYHTSELYGSDTRMGDVDFFINGGVSQPSCSPTLFTRFTPFLKTLTQVCSHGYATELYAKTINDNSMKGCMCPSYLTYTLGSCRCEDTAVLGEFTDNSTTTIGTFYIDTPDTWSFTSVWNRFTSWKELKELGKSWWDALCHD
ncbi:unnamed protein product [Orchesella dallaii]|uniref:Lipase domain-containing protein n=1 Tax=Orchesella dallaii TaxID=48710 RepID=A0ABP1R302_9HEXA